MKVIFAHNSLTSYKPKGVISKMFNFVAKCQTKNPIELWSKGVRGYDIRIRIDKKGNPVVCHGFIDYDVNVYNILFIIERCRRFNDNVYIRLINEDTFYKSDKTRFTEIANNIIKTYNFKFKVYDSKKDWTVIHNDFKEEEYECIGSKTSPIVTPKRFSKKYNQLFNRLIDNIDNGYFFMDFI